MRVLVVDDETLINQYIVQCIKKANADIEIVDAVTSGKKALEIMEKETVDLVFTDITMPRMDGIELLRLLREQYPATDVIMLTCHDDFDYARIAVQNQAKDYILKSEINEDRFRTLFQRLDRERKQRLAGMAQQHVDRSKYLRQVIEKDNDVFPVKTSDLRQNHIYLEDQAFIALLFRNKEENIQIIREAIADDFENPVYHVCEEKEILLLMNLREEGSCPENRRIREYFSRYESQLQGLLGCSLIHHHIEKLHKTITEAFDDRDTRFYERPLTACDRKKDILQLTQYVRRTMIQIEDGDINAGCMELERLLAYIEENTPRVLFMKMSVIQLLSGLQSKTGIDLHNMEEELDSSLSFAAFSRQVKHRIHLLHEQKRLYSASIRKALDYIGLHYAEDISLNSVADIVYLNRDYLSRQFKKEIGINFSEYLMNLRMQKAHQMLETTNMRVSDVAMGVGITNISYFSTVFHKTFGYKPNAVRKYKQTQTNIPT